MNANREHAFFGSSAVALKKTMGIQESRKAS